MFCKNCGEKLEDGVLFCPKCGTSVESGTCKDAAREVKQEAKAFISQAGNEIDSSIEEIENEFKDRGIGNSAAGMNAENAGGYAAGGMNAGYAGGYAAGGTNAGYAGGGPAGRKLRTDRGIISLILLSMITCGIYGYYFIYTLARDVNTACAEDGEETAGLGLYILLSIITCGFYNIYWIYKLGNRLADNAPRYGMTFQETGTTVLLWKILGALICWVGTYYGDYIIIKNTNAICDAYNRRQGF